MTSHRFKDTATKTTAAERNKGRNFMSTNSEPPIYVDPNVLTGHKKTAPPKERGSNAFRRDYFFVTRKVLISPADSTATKYTPASKLLMSRT